MPLLLRVLLHDKPASGFILWRKTPASIQPRIDGSLTVSCADHKGVRGPAFDGKLCGVSPEYGECAEISAHGDDIPSLLDFAVRSGGELVMIGINPERIPLIEQAWSDRVPYAPR